MAEPTHGEWLFEDGIGERRAALIEQGRLAELHVERDDDGVAAGAILYARLIPREGESHWRVAALPSGEEVMLRSVPPGTSDGATFLVEIVRSAVPEADIVKRAIARPAASGVRPAPALNLADRIAATGASVTTLHPHQPDGLMAAGWDDWIDSAANGQMSFPGGLLRMSLTPAMTVFDVDGYLPPFELAKAGVTAMARAVRALGIGGSIVIDLPTLASKAERVLVAEALDAALPLPFERTAINGYGLLQIIRPRDRISIGERMQFRRTESAALALLRIAERQGAARPGQPMTLAGHPAVIAWINARPALLDRLSLAVAATPTLRADPSRGIADGHVE